MTSDKWDKRFFDLAATIAGWSKESGKRVGAVIIGPDKEIRSTGFNGFPRGVNDEIPERHSRETGAKYLWSVHAEVNAICNATLIGVSLKDCTLYTTHFPCVGCAKAIIQCGIKNVISPLPDYNDVRWADEWRISEQMITEAGVVHKLIK